MHRLLSTLLVLSGLSWPLFAQAAQGNSATSVISFQGVDRKEAERILEDRISAGIYLRSPWISRQRGRLDQAMTLGLYGSGGLDSWLIFSDQRRAEFTTMGIPRESGLVRLEWRWIDGWLRAQSTMARTRSMEQIDPLQYVRRVERSIAALVETEYPSAEVRVLELDALLVDLPQFWNLAERSLVNPRRAFSQSAVDALHHLEDWIVLAPKTFDSMTWDPTFALIFEQHLRRAVESTVEFRAWLNESIVEMENFQGAIDRLRWESLASATTGLTVDAEEIHERVLRETADLLMTLPNSDIVEEPDRDALGEALIRGSAKGWAWTQSFGLFEGETEIGVTPRWTAVRGGLAPPSYLSNPRNDSIEVHQAIAPAGGPIHFGVHPWRRTVGGQGVLGLRYGAIGEAWLVAQYVRDRARGEHIWNENVQSALGLYATDWALRIGGDANPLSQDPTILRASLECRIEEALLLLASIELHALKITTPRVSESLSRRGGITREAATYLAEQVLRDPLSGMSFLSYESLTRWENELTQTSSLKAALQTIYRAVREHPTALVKDLRTTFTTTEAGR